MEKLHILDVIEEGMPVLQEHDKEKVGTVEFIRYGEGTDTVNLPETNTIVELLAEAFIVDSDYPREVYEKLYTEGFIRVGRGLQQKTYILPSQIAHVVNGEVHIKVSENELLKA